MAHKWVLALGRGRGFPFHPNFPLLVCNVLIVTLETKCLSVDHSTRSIAETPMYET